MKKGLILSVIALIAMFLFVGCKSEPKETIKNLKTALDGEATASAKYAAYAAKAEKDSMFHVAQLFKAASISEAVHADNMKKALIKLGSVDTVPVIGVFEPKTTAENIQDAINGESYEVNTMYPEFIVTAKNENCDDAIIVYQWALDTEKKHNDLYTMALEKIAVNQSELPVVYFICPKCGNTFTEMSMEDPCPFCMTVKTNYINTEKCKCTKMCCNGEGGCQMMKDGKECKKACADGNKQGTCKDGKKDGGCCKDGNKQGTCKDGKKDGGCCKDQTKQENQQPEKRHRVK